MMKSKILLRFLFIFCFPAEGFIALASSQEWKNTPSLMFKLFEVFMDDLKSQGDRIEAIERNINAWSKDHSTTQESKSGKETVNTQLQQCDIKGDIKQIQDLMIYFSKGLAKEKSLRSENTDFLTSFVDQNKVAFKNLSQTIHDNKLSTQNSIKDLETHFKIFEEKMTSAVEKSICKQNLERVDKIEKENKEQMKKITAAIEKFQTDVDEIKELVASIFDNENIAQGKIAIESSTYDSNYNRGPNAATDGNTDGNWEHYSCTHTQHEIKPWWQVDLGRSYPIKKVVIKNRADCCGERLHDLVITVSNERAGNGEICGYFTGPSKNGATETIICNHTVYGRYVKIQIQSNSRSFLTLCEVQVFKPSLMN